MAFSMRCHTADGRNPQLCQKLGLITSKTSAKALLKMLSGLKVMVGGGGIDLFILLFMNGVNII